MMMSERTRAEQDGCSKPYAAVRSRRRLLAAAAAGAAAWITGCATRTPPTQTPPTRTATIPTVAPTATDTPVPATPSPTASASPMPPAPPTAIAPPATATTAAPTARPIATAMPTVAVPASEQIALGVYLPQAQWDAATIDQFAASAGAMPAIVMWYQDWAHTDFQGFDAAKLDAVAARGAMPMITWEPFDYTGRAEQPAFALRRIIAGVYDPWITAFARASAQWGKPYFLRFAHEMNGDWYPWSPGINGNTSAQYVATWRRVVGIFRREGAMNVRWVWSPTGVFPGSTPFADVYPGGGYVNWIGMNVFNFGTSAAWSEWKSFADILAPSYGPLTRLSDKPIMLTEVSSAELGGDKAAWIRQGLLTDLPERFPRVRAAIWFNERRETDWPIDSSPASLAAFAAVARAPRFAGRIV